MQHCETPEQANQLAGDIKFVLAEKIGKVVWRQKVSMMLIDEVASAL